MEFHKQKNLSIYERVAFIQFSVFRWYFYDELTFQSEQTSEYTKYLFYHSLSLFNTCSKYLSLCSLLIIAESAF